MDLIEKLRGRGINAAFVGEQQRDWHDTMRVLEGEAGIVFISPESAGALLFRDMLRSESYRERMAALVTDDVQCGETLYCFLYCITT